MFRVGSQGIGIGKPKSKPVIKPENVSGAELIRKRRLLLKSNDKHSEDKAASSELPSKT